MNEYKLQFKPGFYFSDNIQDLSDFLPRKLYLDLEKILEKEFGGFDLPSFSSNRLLGRPISEQDGHVFDAKGYHHETGYDDCFEFKYLEEDDFDTFEEYLDWLYEIDNYVLVFQYEFEADGRVFIGLDSESLKKGDFKNAICPWDGT
ncbi:MAG: hypothetical protein GY714_29700 [Desulfobacterales bacterium]|nr:hypothetical protein [Desulfobacterales bacterium]